MLQKGSHQHFIRSIAYTLSRYGKAEAKFCFADLAYRKRDGEDVGKDMRLF